MKATINKGLIYAECDVCEYLYISTYTLLMLAYCEEEKMLSGHLWGLDQLRECLNLPSSFCPICNLPSVTWVKVFHILQQFNLNILASSWAKNTPTWINHSSWHPLISRCENGSHWWEWAQFRGGFPSSNQSWRHRSAQCWRPGLGTLTQVESCLRSVGCCPDLYKNQPLRGQMKTLLGLEARVRNLPRVFLYDLQNVKLEESWRKKNLNLLEVVIAQ